MDGWTDGRMDGFNDQSMRTNTVSMWNHILDTYSINLFILNLYIH